MSQWKAAALATFSLGVLIASVKLQQQTPVTNVNSDTQEVVHLGSAADSQTSAITPQNASRSKQQNLSPSPDAPFSTNIRKVGTTNEETTAYAPDPIEYQRPGKHRTALLNAARKGNSQLKGTLFYSPAIITDGYEAYIISEARTSYSADPVYAAAHLFWKNGIWIATKVEVSDTPVLTHLTEQVLFEGQDSSFNSALTLDIASDYQGALLNTERAFASINVHDTETVEALYERIESDYSARMEALGKLLTASSAFPSASSCISSSDLASGSEPATTTPSTERTSGPLISGTGPISRPRSGTREIRTTESARLRQFQTSVGWSYTPRIAENGSHYGQISEVTRLPRTIYVGGYYRRDGTYVRSHFRSRR